jgi:hypothetical protein
MSNFWQEKACLICIGGNGLSINLKNFNVIEEYRRAEKPRVISSHAVVIASAVQCAAYGRPPLRRGKLHQQSDLASWLWNFMRDIGFMAVLSSG